MAAQILDGKAISAELRGTIAQRVARLREKGVTPGLAVILVGADPASQIYVRNKSVGCDQVGIHSVTINLPETTTQDELEKLIARLNADDTIHGILVQHPLPKHLDEAAALAVIAPEKDVDGFHLLNAGRMMSGQPGVVACTPKGAMEMIRRTGIDLDGKEAVVVGRSNIVGKPMAMLLLQANCTVTICHSHTVNLAQHTRNADILKLRRSVSRGSSPRAWSSPARSSHVGINRVNGKVVGDVMPDVADVAGYITPVPGGVGKMTIVELLENTVEAAEKQTAH